MRAIPSNSQIALYTIYKLIAVRSANQAMHGLIGTPTGLTEISQ